MSYERPAQVITPIDLLRSCRGSQPRPYSSHPNASYLQSRIPQESPSVCYNVLHGCHLNQIMPECACASPYDVLLRASGRL